MTSLCCLSFLYVDESVLEFTETACFCLPNAGVKRYIPLCPALKYYFNNKMYRMYNTGIYYREIK